MDLGSFDVCYSKLDLQRPIIDILLVVQSSADENSYVPALEASGYVLRIRA